MYAYRLTGIHRKKLFAHDDELIDLLKRWWPFKAVTLNFFVVTTQVSDIAFIVVGVGFGEVDDHSDVEKFV